MNPTTKKLPRGIFEKYPGSGVYSIRYTDAEGKYRREKAGTFSAARDLLVKRQNQALVGEKLPETLRRRGVLFSEIAADCLLYSDQHKRSKRMDHSRMKKLLEWFRSTAADNLTAQEIENHFQTATWARATRNKYKALLSLTYKLAIKNKKVKANPARDVKHLRENNGRIRFLSIDEEKRLRQAIAERFPHRMAEFDLSLQTGMRHSEQYGAKWKDVDFEHRILTVWLDKSGNTSHVQLNDAAVKALLELKQMHGNADYICGGYTSTDWFEDCVKAAGITNYTWHVNRHTFASRLTMAGAGPRAVADLLRDTTLSMAMRYSHLSPEYKDEALKRMEKKFRIRPTISTTVAPSPVRRGTMVN